MMNYAPLSTKAAGTADDKQEKENYRYYQIKAFGRSAGFFEFCFPPTQYDINETVTFTIQRPTGDFDTPFEGVYKKEHAAYEFDFGKAMHVLKYQYKVPSMASAKPSSTDASNIKVMKLYGSNDEAATKNWEFLNSSTIVPPTDPESRKEEWQSPDIVVDGDSPTPDVDYNGLISGRKANLYVALASSLCGGIATVVAVSHFWLHHPECAKDTNCMSGIAMQISGFSIYWLCLLPPWRRRDKMELHDTDEDMYRNWSYIAFVSVSLLVCVLALVGLILQIYPKTISAVFMLIAIGYPPFNFVFRFTPIGVQTAKFSRRGEHVYGKHSIRKKTDGVSFLFGLMNFETSGIFGILQLLIFANGVVSWLVVSFYHYHSGDQKLMMGCLIRSCFLILFTHAFRALAQSCLVINAVTSDKNAEHVAKNSTDQDTTGQTAPQDTDPSFYYKLAAWFFGRNVYSPVLEETREPHRITEEIVWGIRLFFLPLDTGSSLIVMVVKQLAGTSVILIALFKFWAHIQEIKAMYKLQCLGPKGLAIFVVDDTDPFTPAGTPWVSIIERVCRENGPGLVNMPFRFEGKVAEEAGILFEIVFMAVTVFMLWGLLFVNYRSANVLHPAIFDDCRHWSLPLLNKFPETPIKQLIPLDVMNSKTQMKARVWIRKSKEFLDIPQGDPDVDLKDPEVKETWKGKQRQVAWWWLNVQLLFVDPLLEGPLPQNKTFRALYKELEKGTQLNSGRNVIQDSAGGPWVKYFLSSSPPGVFVAMLPILLPAVFASFGWIDSPHPTLVRMKIPFFVGEEVPFHHFRRISAFWMWIFTSVFFQEFSHNLRDYSKVLTGYAYLKKMIVSDSPLPIFLDVGGEKIVDDQVNAKKSLSGDEVRANLSLWMTLRRYLRLMLVAPMARLNGLLGVSSVLFLLLFASALMESLAGDGPLSPLAKAVLKTGQQIGSNLTSELGKAGSALSGDIASATQNTTELLTNSLSKAANFSSASSALSNGASNAASEFGQVAANYKNRVVGSFSDAVTGANYTSWFNAEWESLDNLQTAKVSLFTATVFIYIALLTYYTLRTVFSIALTNDLSLEQADHLTAAQEKGISNPKSKDSNIKDRLDVAIKSTRSETSLHLQTIWGKVITMSVVFGAVITVIYPQKQAVEKRVPLVVSYGCKWMANRPWFNESSNAWDAFQDQYNHTLTSAFAEATHRVNEVEVGLGSLLNTSQGHLIHSIDNAHSTLTGLTDQFENISSSFLIDTRTKILKQMEILSTKALERLTLARNLLKETAKDAHDWATGAVNRVATVAAGVVTQALDAAEDAVHSLHAKISETISSVFNAVSAAAKAGLKKLQEGVDNAVNFLQDQITKSKLALKKALNIAASWANGALEAANMQVTVLGQTLFNVADNVFASISSRKKELESSFNQVLSNLGNEARGKVQSLQQSITAQIYLIEQTVTQAKHSVDGAINKTHHEASDIIAAAKAKVTQITSSLRKRVSDGLGEIAKAQNSLNTIASQMINTAGQAAQQQIKDAVNGIQNELDTAASLVDTTRLRIENILKGTSLGAVSNAKQMQSISDQLRDSLDKQSKIDKGKLKTIKQDVSKKSASWKELLNSASQSDMAAIGKELGKALTVAIEKVGFFTTQVDKLIDKAPTVSSDAFAACKNTAVAAVKDAFDQSLANLKNKEISWEAAVAAAKSDSGVMLTVAKSKIVADIRNELTKADSILSEAGNTALSTIANMKVWADGTLVVADSSLSAMVSEATQTLEQRISKVSAERVRIRGYVSKYNLDYSTSRDFNVEVDNVVSRLESLKVVLKGAIASAHSGSHEQLQNIRGQMTNISTQVSSQTASAIKVLQRKREELANYLHTQIVKVDENSREALKAGEVAIITQLNSVQDVLDQSAHLMHNAADSAESAAKGLLNATRDQMDLFSGTINSGIDIAEDALRRKQEEMSAELDEQLAKAHGKAKSTIEDAQSALHKQLGAMQDQLNGTRASLDQSITHLASYASGTLDGVKSTVKGFANSMEAGISSAKRQCLKTTDEIEEVLIKKIRIARASAKGSIDRAREALTKKLDTTLVVVYRKMDEIHDSLKSGIQSITDGINSGINAGFDWVQNTLNTVIEKVRGGLDLVANYLISHITEAFEGMRSALRDVADTALKYINKAQKALTIPPMDLKELMEQYVCKPLEIWIVNQLKAADKTLRNATAHYKAIEQRNQVPPAPAPAPTTVQSRRLELEKDSGASLDNKYLLTDAVAKWWREEDERYISSSGFPPGPTVLARRHADVVAALEHLQAEIREEHESVIEKHLDEFYRMRLGLTRQAHAQWEILKSTGIVVPGHFFSQGIAKDFGGHAEL